MNSKSDLECAVKYVIPKIFLIIPDILQKILDQSKRRYRLDSQEVGVKFVGAGGK
jgi:hypothetical protein